MKKTTIWATIAFTIVSLTLSACNQEKATHEQEQTVVSEKGEEQQAKQEISEPWMQQSSFTDAHADAKKHVSDLTQHYLATKDALVDGKPTEAIQHAQMLSKTIAEFKPDQLSDEQKQFYQEHATAAKETAESIYAATDVEEQRSQLNELSQHVYALSKGFGAGSGSLYLQHCPMARNNEGGYWLSTSDEIRNPYFGEKMLKCGETKMKL